MEDDRRDGQRRVLQGDVHDAMRIDHVGRPPPQRVDRLLGAEIGDTPARHAVDAHGRGAIDRDVDLVQQRQIVPGGRELASHHGEVALDAPDPACVPADDGDSHARRHPA